MRNLIVVLIATFVIQLGIPHADACGDKTMRVRESLPYFQLQAARHPSKILIYSASLPPGKAVELRNFLNDKVGHKATVKDDVGSIKSDLITGHYDLVLTNLAEARELQKQVESFTPKTLVVPVLFKQPKSEAKAAAKQYKVIMKDPKDGLDFMIAVSQVMKLQSSKS